MKMAEGKCKVYTISEEDLVVALLHSRPGRPITSRVSLCETNWLLWAL